MSAGPEPVAIFLRGINTGGMTLKMAGFREALTEANCTRVTTIQTAGTAVCACQGTGRSVLKADIEQRLSLAVGKPVKALLRTAAQIEEIVTRMADDLSPETHHDYVFFVDGPDIFPAIAALHADIAFQPGERLEPGDGWFRWSIPRGETLGDFGAKVLSSRKFKDALTSRNFRTVLKVRDEMRRLAG